ncbi:MAG: phage tail length tape measure family protein [Pseudomonadota bacterium]|nr:phage tail length tape measure family protein [Pseudomonadota bacterium]
MDVAALSLRIDSSDLVKASADLDKFATSASKAGATAAKSTTAGAAQMSRGLSRSAQSAVAAAASVDRYAGSSARAAAEARLAAAGVDTANKQWERASVALARVEPAAQKAAASIGRVGKAANDNAARMGGSMSGLAAQFQDIGVTAAMGMSPMMIALQQGTQIAGQLEAAGQSGTSALGTLGQSIKSLLSPTMLLTIGIVGLAAAGLQMVDWTSLAQTALDAVASGMDMLAASAETLVPVVIAAGGAMLVAFGPQILSAVVSVATAIGGAFVSAIVAATKAMIAFALANPFTAIVLGVAAAGAAIAYFAGATMEDVKKAIDFVVGGFVGAFNTVKRTWSMLPAAIGDAAVQAVNWALRAITNLINRSIDGINALIDMIPEFMRPGKLGQFGGLGQLSNPWAGTLEKVGSIAAEEFGKAHGVKYTDSFIKAAKDALSGGADAIRGLASGLGADSAAKAPGAGAGAGPAAARSATKVDKWGELLADADRQQRALEQAGAQIGVYGQDLAQLRREQELFNQAQDNGIALTAAMSQELSGRAAALAAKEYANTRAQAAADNARWHTEQMRQLEVERESLGLTGEALIAYKYQQEMINQALATGVALKDIDIQKIAEQAQAYAAAAAANDATRQAIDDQRTAMEANREIVKGFFTDWINGVREGENVFKSFERSITKALNNLIDLMINNLLNQMLGMGGGMGGMPGAGMGGGAAGMIGGILGTLFMKGVFSLFGEIFGNGGTFGTAQKYAHGGTFGTPHRFANGGTFTNQIITAPTLFRFANGAKIGEMGEAGPEAVMPLSRGPNGKLGVLAHGGGGGANIRLGDITNVFRVEGAVTADTIMAMVRAGGEQTITQVRRDLQSMLAELDQNGAMV